MAIGIVEHHAPNAFGKQSLQFSYEVIQFPAQDVAIDAGITGAS